MDEGNKPTVRHRKEDQVSVQFQHTQLGVYLAGAFGLVYIWASSAQGIVDKYHFSKKWFYLYGALCCFAYLYLRPFVRRGLGSAHRGYLNFSSLYILWLCSALFCHLPSLEALGLDIKADVSLALSIAASSLLVLGVLHGLQLLCIHLKWLAPAPGATRQAVWTCIILNSVTLAAACSTYFQLCGNGAVGLSTADGKGLVGSGFLQEAVCMRYLAPIPTKEYPTFSAWMLVGERNASSAAAARAPAASPPAAAPAGGSIVASISALLNASSSPEPPAAAAAAPLAINTTALATLVSSVPLAGPEDGETVISPVFTMWITLVALYIINVLADQVSASNMSAAHISELRREVVADHDLALLAALSAAAGKSLKEGANQLAAAQQQRHQQQQQQGASFASRSLKFRSDRGRQEGRSGLGGGKRSKSLEMRRQQPWSPRFMVERTMVNLLETTSSFSFKAAELLQGIDSKGFPSWQQLQHQGLGSLGGALNLNTLSKGFSGQLGSGFKRQQPQRATTGGTSAGKSSRRSFDKKPSSNWQQQQWGIPEQQQEEQQQHQRPAVHRKALRHTRSKSLSSIQSGCASGIDDDSEFGDMKHNSSSQALAAGQGVATGYSQGSGAAVGQGTACPSTQCLAGASSSQSLQAHTSSISLRNLPVTAGDSNSSLHSLPGGQLGSSRPDRTAKHSSREADTPSCSSPFAAAQLRQQLGFGGFGSVVSLYSPTWEGQEEQKHIAEVLAAAAAAAAEGESPVAAAAAAAKQYDNASSGAAAAAAAAAVAREASTHAAESPAQSQQASGQVVSPFMSVDSNTFGPDYNERPTVHAVRGSAGSTAPHNPKPLRTSDPHSLSSLSQCDTSVGGADSNYGEGQVSGGGAAEVPGSSPGQGRGFGSKTAGPSPPFLDMVPWYSGTSADLFKTMFDLMISLKLFLGRFDMRTMQAATAASMADSFNDTPAEGDGFTYEHFHTKQELWFDFIADTGDGGNPTYTVARALAAPQLVVPVNGAVRRQQQQVVVDSGLASINQQQQQQQEEGMQQQQQQLQLPRGDVLLIGGDLAYPNPSRETYESRLFVPFQEAMPPPPHYHPGRLVVHKPDLPPSYGAQGQAAPTGLSPRSSRYASVAALRAYPGPNVFAIPGNHDWIDGLETFIKQIMHKGWLGGWLMPQEKSYFALRLPAGWWVFGLDLALVGDIDMCQYRYFANVVERRLGPNDNVIIITHEPTWLLEWFWASSSSSNLRQLVRGHLRGRARVHLAGDLHFYMRHSYNHQKQQQQQQQGGSTQGPAAAAAAPEAADGSGAVTSATAAAAIDKVAAADVLLCNPALCRTPTLAAPVDSGGPSQVLSRNGSSISGSGEHAALAAAARVADAARSDRRISNESSSSSGVDSCNTPLEPYRGFEILQPQNQNPIPPAAAAEPAAVSAADSALQAEALGPQLHSRNTSRELDEPGSPVLLARRTLPKLVVGKTLSRGGSGDMGALGWNANSSRPAAAAAAAAGLGSSSGQQQQQQSHPQQQQQQHWQNLPLHQTLLDPEHLIVNGLGGAFLHPTHVFSYSRFACLEDEAAAATAATYSSTGHTSLVPGGPMSGNSSCSSFAAHPALGATPGVPPLNVHSITSNGPYGTAAATGAGGGGGGGVRHASGYAWEPDMLSWHCPMSPSGVSDIWEQQSVGSHNGGHAHGPPLKASHTAAAGAGPAAAAATGVGQQVTLPPTAAGMQQGSASFAAAAAAAAGAVGTGSAPAAAAAAAVSSGSTGVYKCAALFPPAEKSLRLGRKNLHLFRFKNSRFDVIGGAIYFLSIVSILPRCSAGLALLSATNLLDFTAIFAREFLACWYDIFMTSYLSLGVTVLFFLITFGFAKGGGVGAVSGERQQLQQQHREQLKQQQQQHAVHVPKPVASSGPSGSSSKLCGSKRRSPVVGPLVKLRTGGCSTQLLVALLHAGAHLSLAVVLLLLLELGVEVCIKYEHLGSDGLHSMYRWFEAYQEAHFPDPMGLRAMAHKWSLGLYPGVIQAAMAVYDIPEAVAVARNAVCAAGDVATGFSSLSRLQVLSYYAGMLAYYWLLAIPAMGFVFGLYLYVCVCWFHVHYDEAFSALRIANFKGLTRLHITKDGDLEIFTLGIDRVPTSWREDPKWYSPQGGGGGRVASHAAAYPSRWVPDMPQKGDAFADDSLDPMDRISSSGEGLGFVDSCSKGAVHPDDASMGLRNVDYLKVPRQRPGLQASC